MEHILNKKVSLALFNCRWKSMSIWCEGLKDFFLVFQEYYMYYLNVSAPCSLICDLLDNNNNNIH